MGRAHDTRRGAPICNIVLQHFYRNMVDAIRTTPQETLFGSVLLIAYSSCGFWLLAPHEKVCEKDTSQHAVGGIARVFYFPFINSSLFFYLCLE